MRAVAVMIALLAAVQQSIAGGSVEWKFHALPLLRKAPELLRIVEMSLDVERVGEGVRVGRDSSGQATVPELGVGTRVPPFEFAARPKGSTGPRNLLLIIHNDENRIWIEIKPKT